MDEKSEQEKQWAVALNKKKTKDTKQNASKKTEAQDRVSLQRKLTDVKKLALEAAAAGEKKKVEDYFNRFVDLRAQKTAIELNNMKQAYGKVLEPVVKKYSAEYISDCSELAKRIDGIINKAG